MPHLADLNERGRHFADGPRTDIARIGYRPEVPPRVCVPRNDHARRYEIFDKQRSEQHARRSPEPQIGASPRWLRRARSSDCDGEARLWLAYPARSMIARTSILPRRASGILEATSTAS